MELKLGANIAALRRAKGMTQEQLAAALGISPPAVSKWETNTSYPDITLLCPLARALDTNVDMLLNYEKTLPDEEVVQKINDLLALARTTGWQAAESALKNLLHQYPTSVSLKFHGAGLYAAFQVICPDAGTEERAAWDRQRKELFRRTGQTQKLIENLCRCLDGLSVPVQPPNEALFPALPIQDTHHEADQRLRQIIYLSIQQACQSEEYKNDPNLRAAMKRLKDIFST